MFAVLTLLLRCPLWLSLIGVYLHKTGRLLLRTMTQSDANSIAFTFILPEGAPGAASNATEPAAKPPDHVPTASRQLRVCRLCVCVIWIGGLVYLG